MASIIPGMEDGILVINTFLYGLSTWLNFLLDQLTHHIHAYDQWLCQSAEILYLVVGHFYLDMNR